MQVDHVITTRQFKAAREKSDDIWDDYDVFDEERDKFPLRELVATAVEGQFTHPSGHHSAITLSDSVDGLVWDYAGDAIPDGIPSSVEEKFTRKLQDEAYEAAERVYESCKADADDADSIAEIQSILETHLDKQNVTDY